MEVVGLKVRKFIALEKETVMFKYFDRIELWTVNKDIPVVVQAVYSGSKEYWTVSFEIAEEKVHVCHTWEEVEAEVDFLYNAFHI